MTGAAILAMAITAGFAYGYVIDSLVIRDNGTATVQNIAGAQPLFNTGIFAWILIFLLDVFVAWGLFIFFKAEDKKLAFFSAFLRFVYACFLAVAIFSLIAVSLEINVIHYRLMSDLPQIEAKVIASFNSFHNVWSAGLIVFGIHLLTLALLILTKTNAPNLIGYLLLAAAGSYIVVHLSYLVFPTYDTHIAAMEMFLSIPMAVGELSLGVWLIWRCKTS